MLLGVDVGGTFTDAVLVGDDGIIYTAKAPSTPAAQEQGVMAAIAAVLARADAEAWSNPTLRPRHDCRDERPAGIRSPPTRTHRASRNRRVH